MYESSKPNVVFNVSDAQRISRIIVCAADSCSRAIVEYDRGTSTSKHRRGIPHDTIAGAKELGTYVIERACDHHGGKQYDPNHLQF